MKKYTAILFDMDGTLVDTFRGIKNSYEYAADSMSFKMYEDSVIGNFIGAPLSEVFAKSFKLSDEQVRQAIEYYRYYYNLKGYTEVEIYDGIPFLLSYLKKHDYKIGIATLKREDFAIKIINNLKLENFFDVICGIDNNDKLTKSQIINKCMEKLEVNSNETLYIGDSIYDSEGAFISNADFIAVTYGYGFKSEKDIEEQRYVCCADKAKSIADYLEKNK